MAKFRASIQTRAGDLQVEGESIEDLKAGLEEVGLSKRQIEALLNAKSKPPYVHPTSVARLIAKAETELKPDLEGLVELSSDGSPHLNISASHLAAKDAIRLLLYAVAPLSLSLGELTNLVGANWKATSRDNVSAYMNQMKTDVLKEGKRGNYVYKLSGGGVAWVREQLLPKLRNVPSAQTAGSESQR
jgi:hypothetical protein